MLGVRMRLWKSPRSAGNEWSLSVQVFSKIVEYYCSQQRHLLHMFAAAGVNAACLCSLWMRGYVLPPGDSGRPFVALCEVSRVALSAVTCV